MAEASPALATEQLRGEGEEDDREEEVGWAAGGAGPAGLPGERQVVPLLFPSLFYFLQFVFYLIATEFKFKQLENSAKIPLDIFMSHNGLLHIYIKYHRLFETIIIIYYEYNFKSKYNMI